LSPIKQSRELNPLDATLDSKPQKQAVEMRFYRALGNVQIPSNFRVVTSLKQQIDDLPFPRPYLAERLFHNTAPDRRAPVAVKWLSSQVPGRIWEFGSLRLILHSRGQIALCEVN
jgi:hypothetical protein